jgi:hypothetical protein
MKTDGPLLDLEANEGDPILEWAEEQALKAREWRRLADEDDDYGSHRRDALWQDEGGEG